MKLLCVITGGTFGSNKTDKGIGINVAVDLKLLKNTVKKYFSDSISIDFITPIFKLSENIDERDWNILNREIEDKIDSYDSVLVVHGTDTMAYTSSALSYNENISKKKPIVVTGANLPLSFDNTDAIVNFVQSIQALEKFIKLDVKGVFIVFNGSNNFNSKALIHLGTRVKKDKWEESCYRSFYINSQYLGYITNHEFSFDIEKYDHLFNKKILYKNQIIYDSKKVSSFKIYPGFDPSILQREFDYGKRYFIIEIYNSGTAPIKDTHLSLYKSLHYIHEMGGIVFAVSQHEGKSGATMDIYESSKMLRELSIIPLKDIIWESAVVKLMNASTLFNDKDALIKYMLKNISGEIL